ncbi:RHS repeat-associated core domain-containing protein [Porticoccus sp. GXU_MW_L64]
MNGRIYDPKIARFLQADPFIQEPTYSQSLNRYAYVWNNPLNSIDPSGYELVTLGGFVKFVISSLIATAIANITYKAPIPQQVIRTLGLPSGSFSSGIFGTIGRIFTPSDEYNILYIQGQGSASDKSEAGSYSEETGGKYANGTITVSWGYTEQPSSETEVPWWQKIIDVLGAPGREGFERAAAREPVENRDIWQDGPMEDRRIREMSVENQKAIVEMMMVGSTFAGREAVFITSTLRNSSRSTLNKALRTIDEAPVPRLLSNKEVRDWYVKNVREIGNRINKNASTVEQALEAYQMRTDVRTTARMLMRDRELARTLPEMPSLADIVRRKYEKGLRGDDLWRDVIRSAQTPNANVNKIFGIE